MPKQFRIDVPEDLHQALVLQAARNHTTVKEYATSILHPAIDNATWAFLGLLPDVKQTARVNPEALDDRPTEVPKAESTSVPIQRLSDDLAAQARIKKIWISGERNRRVIALEVGYKERTVQQYIKDCLDSGELVR